MSFSKDFLWGAPRFCLIHIDYTTQKRTLKDSALHYAGIIRTKGETL